MKATPSEGEHVPGTWYATDEVFQDSILLILYTASTRSMSGFCTAALGTALLGVFGSSTPRILPVLAVVRPLVQAQRSTRFARLIFLIGLRQAKVIFGIHGGNILHDVVSGGRRIRPRLVVAVKGV